MKRIALAFLLPFVPGCLVDNDLAENPDNVSTETRLDQNRTDWCESFCEQRVTCANTSCDCGEPVCYCLEQIDMPTCLQGCDEYLAGFVGQGEACAEDGLEQMECLQAVSCDQLATGACAETEARCGLEEPGPGPGPGTPVPAGLITCGMSGGQGVAPGAQTFECGSEAHECSDGHDYGSHCVETPDHRGFCTCSVDYETTGSFYLPVLACPSEADVNVGCGFALAPSSPGGITPTDCNGAEGGGTSPNGFGCSSEFSCENGTFAVICSEERGYPACACYANGKEVGDFIVPDAVCPVGDPELGLERINAGCGWGLAF
jgi:hypothetical protein